MTSHDIPPNPRVKPVYDDHNELDPVIFEGENADTYLEFRAKMYAAQDVADETDSINLHGAIINHWDAARHRRLLAKFIAASEHEGLRALLTALPLPPAEIDAHVRAFRVGDHAAVDGVLAAVGLDLETIRAQTIALRLDDIGKFEAIIAGLERRRDLALRDLARARRARLADKNGARRVP